MIVSKLKDVSHVPNTRLVGVLIRKIPAISHKELTKINHSNEQVVRGYLVRFRIIAFRGLRSSSSSIESRGVGPRSAGETEVDVNIKTRVDEMN